MQPPPPMFPGPTHSASGPPGMGSNPADFYKETVNPRYKPKHVNDQVILSGPPMPTQPPGPPPSISAGPELAISHPVGAYKQFGFEEDNNDHPDESDEVDNDEDERRSGCCEKCTCSCWTKFFAVFFFLTTLGAIVVFILVGLGVFDIFNFLKFGKDDPQIFTPGELLDGCNDHVLKGLNDGEIGFVSCLDDGEIFVCSKLNGVGVGNYFCAIGGASTSVCKCTVGEPVAVNNLTDICADEPECDSFDLADLLD